MAKGTILDLDELFGQDDPVIVVYQGTTYELLRPDAWTPEVYARYVRLQKSISEDEVKRALEDPEAFEKLAKILDKVLEIISPELAALDLSMEKKSAIIEHYASVVFPKELAAARTRVEAKNLIGA